MMRSYLWTLPLLAFVASCGKSPPQSNPEIDALRAQVLALEQAAAHLQELRQAEAHLHAEQKKKSSTELAEATAKAAAEAIKVAQRTGDLVEQFRLLSADTQEQIPRVARKLRAGELHIRDLRWASQLPQRAFLEDDLLFFMEWTPPKGQGVEAGFLRVVKDIGLRLGLSPAERLDLILLDPSSPGNLPGLSVFANMIEDRSKPLPDEVIADVRSEYPILKSLLVVRSRYESADSAMVEAQTLRDAK